MTDRSRERLVAHRDRTGFAIVYSFALGLIITSSLGGAWLYAFLVVFALAGARYTYVRGRDFERRRIRAVKRDALSPTRRAEA